MSFKNRLTERIPKKNDNGGNPLKSCPFCGSNDVVLREASVVLQTNARVFCGKCGCGTQGVALNTIAIGLWNRRSQ